MKNKIYIISEPIHSGKTTMLWQWANNTHLVGGFLTPDIEGKRKLLKIDSGLNYDLQLPDDAEGIKIGKFNFSEYTFAIAREWLKEAKENKYNWFVIDEIGRLEINENKGLEPALNNLLNDFKHQVYNTKLLLVIRDYLLNDVLKHYQITHFEVLNKVFFNSVA